ncbi:riboflavin synthase [Alkalilimnicola ehrlichii]|uniref:Riboflavin synthase n=1 Tax=Alkalilimnicola ehrlichii TaxID=351052 RepID=A0A3E0WPK5_9GAMM|nr:riboflavin synthase [Alkalilimnicola ehrlichii]RFA27013.1 riboflavin synthase [Alkalilimnicola ehrlichii]RFA34133.1 riboflavin synthase [Alkalilimnicola ehrlichii]
MFTGIVQAVGTLRRREPRGGDIRLEIATGELDLTRAAIGDSIAVNGVCLTAVSLESQAFAADVSGETLARTSLGNLSVGDRLNLETALTLSTPLGGHLVSGHVDGLGEIVERSPDARSERFRLRAPDSLARYIAEKGSICIDGVSLTVNRVEGAEFEINIVPHTLAATTIGEFRPGRKVNLEVDLVARYLERLLLGERAAEPAGGGLTREFLEQNGFGARR